MNKLNEIRVKDGSRRELSEAVDNLPVNAKFYMVSENRGEVQETYEIVKNGSDDYKINGKQADKSEFVKFLRDGAPGIAQKEKPDTSSSFEILGSKGKPIDGLSYAKGKYDIAKNIGKMQIRKFSIEGKVTTYNGTQYGVQKVSNGVYQITHIPTGTAHVTQPSTMKGVSAAIKDMDSKIKNIDKDYIENLKKRFKNTLRG